MSKIFMAGLGVLVVAGSVLFAQWRTPASPNAAAISACIEDLTSCDYQVREQALVKLRSFGPESTVILTRTLHRRDSPVTEKLIALSRRLPFVTVRNVNTASLRVRAAEQLCFIAEPDDATVESVVLGLSDHNEDVVQEVQRALRRFGPRTIPQLTAALGHRDVGMRTGAAQVLGDFGATAEPAVPQLIVRLNDRKVSVRAEAANSLGRIGSGEAIPALSRRLEDSSAIVRHAAVVALGAINTTNALARLMTRLSDPNTQVRIAAAKAIWLVTRRAELAVPTLVGALKDREAGGQATFVLGEIGREADAAIPALLQSLQEEKVHRPLRTPPSAALALGRIGSSAVPGLMTLLDARSPKVRTSSVITLGFIGRSASIAVPKLVSLLNDKDPELRQASVIALGSIQPENGDLLPALKALARDDDIFLASAASAMLRDLAPSIAQELPLE